MFCRCLDIGNKQKLADKKFYKAKFCDGRKLTVWGLIAVAFNPLEYVKVNKDEEELKKDYNLVELLFHTRRKYTTTV